MSGKVACGDDRCGRGSGIHRLLASNDTTSSFAMSPQGQR